MTKLLYVYSDLYFIDKINLRGEMEPEVGKTNFNIYIYIDKSLRLQKGEIIHLISVQMLEMKSI